ncbi:amino acid racemase [Roseovarius sp. A21]|uniref:Amino acid racemase n=1 Tax=Roseovarius bejariae TaxID=2576383 RepID=A0A844D221_9RHOB|nr:amino acid racemase [Roseovarius bejariae]MRU16274.1 amino acid racemase [Roseovarius bejariae]
MKTIGILGGMGPEATILLMQKVFKAVPDARDDADHIPLIVHQNPQVPSRIKALIEGTGADPAPILAHMAQDLEKAGVSALAMPCNTAHHYAPVVQAASPLPFLNMLDLTADHLARAGAKTVGMLASPATRLTGVFDAPFAERGLTPLTLPDDGALLEVIRAVKAGQYASQTGPELKRIALQLRDHGADHLLVACTELSLLTNNLPDDMPWTDSLDCLVSGIVKFARS